MHDKSTINYFEIFSAADREMIHSAMMEFLFNDNFFREKFFPGIKFPAKPDFTREYVFPKTRLRCDLVIQDGDKPILFLENKFKSFPTRKQLDDYTKEIRKIETDRKLPPNTPRYLLAFNSAALGDCLAENTGWIVLSYNDVKEAITGFLLQNPAMEDRKQRLLQEYVDFLNDYITQYEKVIENPLHLTEFTDLEKRRNYNLFRRLFLGNIASRLNRDVPDLVISANSGGAKEPLLDIYPPDWNKIPYQGSVSKKEKEQWPKIFMQLQGDKIKFYLRWREAGTDKKKDIDPTLVQSVVEYIGKLQGLNGIDLEHIKIRMDSKNASCTICERPFTLTDNIEDSVSQVLDFYSEIDKAVKKCGAFL